MVKNKTILLFGDTHFPFHHQDTFEFLKAVKKKYKPDEVYCMGDLIDNHALSYHETNPDLYSPRDELELSVMCIEDLAKIFPKMTILSGNHDKLPIRKARSAGLPSRYIRSNSDVFNMPKTWEWKFEEIVITTDKKGLWLRHQFSSNPIEIALAEGISVAQGHYHSKGDMIWIKDKVNDVYAITVPCLIDDKSLAMEYNKLDKKRPVLGAVIIQNGVPEMIYMEKLK